MREKWPSDFNLIHTTEKWPSDVNLIHVIEKWLQILSQPMYWYLYTEMASPQQPCWYPLNLKLKYTTMAVFIFLLDFRPYYGQDNKKNSKELKNSEAYNA